VKDQTQHLWRDYSNSSYCHSFSPLLLVYYPCSHYLGVRYLNQSRSSSCSDGVASVLQTRCCGRTGSGTCVRITRPHEDRYSAVTASMPPHGRHLPGALESRIGMGQMTWLTGTSIDTSPVANPVPRSKRVEYTVHLLGFRFQEEFRAKSSERHIQPQARKIKVLHVMPQGGVVDTTTSLMLNTCQATRVEKEYKLTCHQATQQSSLSPGTLRLPSNTLPPATWPWSQYLVPLPE